MGKFCPNSRTVFLQPFFGSGHNFPGQFKHGMPEYASCVFLCLFAFFVSGKFGVYVCVFFFAFKCIFSFDNASLTQKFHQNGTPFQAFNFRSSKRLNLWKRADLLRKKKPTCVFLRLIAFYFCSFVFFCIAFF